MRTPVPSAEGRASGSGRRRGTGNAALGGRRGRTAMRIHAAAAPDGERDGEPARPPRGGYDASSTMASKALLLLSPLLTRKANPGGSARDDRTRSTTVTVSQSMAAASCLGDLDLGDGERLGGPARARRRSAPGTRRRRRALATARRRRRTRRPRRGCRRCTRRPCARPIGSRRGRGGARGRGHVAPAAAVDEPAAVGELPGRARPAAAP